MGGGCWVGKGQWCFWQGLWHGLSRTAAPIQIFGVFRVYPRYNGHKKIHQLIAYT